MQKTIKIILLVGLLFNLVQQAESQQKKRQTKNSQSKTVQTKNLTAEQIAKKYLQSVVLIVCDDGKGNYSQGSGFFIRQGIILTNNHVIEEMVRGKVKTVANNNKSKEWWIKKVLYTDTKNDLALISIIPEIEISKIQGIKDDAGNQKEKKLPKVDTSGAVEIKQDWDIPTLKVSESDEITIGEAIFVLSNPKGLTGTISQGIISSGIRKIKDIELLQIDAPISAGSSGGAVINSRGEVVGIATASLSSGQNLNFAIPTSQIKVFIKRYETYSINKDYAFTKISELPNAWLKGNIIDLKNPVKIQQSFGSGLGQGNQTPKTENKSKVTYAEIAQDLVAKLSGSTFKYSEKSVDRVSSVSFSGCSMKLKTSLIKSNDVTTNLYDVNLKNLEDISYTSFSREITMSANLTFSRSIIEITETEASEGMFLASLTKKIIIPITLENLKAVQIGRQFRQLKESCSDTENKSEPTLKETTDWLTEKVQGTKISSGDFSYRYELLGFSSCDMTLTTTVKSGGFEELNSSLINMRFLRNVSIIKNTNGNWGVWLEFGRNFDIVKETFGYLGKRENVKEDKITILFDNYETAKRVGNAFVKILELCGEETKEPF
jgi:S1-C subfamily serine protease